MVVKLFKKKDDEKTQAEIIKPMKEVKTSEDEKPKMVGLSAQMQELNEKMEILADLKKDKDGKNKPFKVPWRIRRQLKRFAKNNKIQVIYLRENRVISPLVTTIKDGLARLENRIYTVGLPFVYLWNGKIPTIVLPEWSMNPIGTADYYRAVDNKETGVYAQKELIRALQASVIEEKKKMKFMWVLFIFAGLAILAYIFFFNKKK